MAYDTPLSPEEEAQFTQWKKKFAPKDSGMDYDLRGAFKSGLKPDPASGHWPDTYKKPNHPTFSDQSIYAKEGKPGSWKGETYIPYKETQVANEINDKMPFGDAFRAARKANLPEFTWRGRPFKTQVAGETMPAQASGGTAPPPQLTTAMPPPAAPQQTYQPPLLPPGMDPRAGAGVMGGVPAAAPAAPMAEAANPMDMAATGLDPSWAPGPPKTSEERAQRVSGWQEFFSKIQSDPKLQMLMLRMGTQLLQPRAPGQTQAGAFGNAVAGSVDYMQALNSAQQKAQLEQMKVGADVEQSKAATEASRANTAQSQAAEGRAKEQFPKQLALIDKQLAAATTTDELNRVKLGVEKFKSDPKYMQNLQDKEMKELDIRMRAEEARIRAYEAAAAKSNREGSALTAAERKMQAEEDASIEYVRTIEEDIQQFTADLSAKKGKEIPLSLGREEFFADKPTLAAQYYKYAGLAAKRMKESEKAGGKGKTPPPEAPGAMDTLKGQTPAQLRERTKGQSDFTVIRQPDGSVKLVPTKKVGPTGGNESPPMDFYQ